MDIADLDAVTGMRSGIIRLCDQKTTTDLAGPKLQTRRKLLLKIVIHDFDSLRRA